MRRMTFSNRLLFLLLIAQPIVSTAQTSVSDKNCKPPISRARWHDDIDKAQKRLIDQKINAGDNEDLNFFVNGALTKRVDAMQCMIDSDVNLREQQKIAYLRGLETLLRGYSASYRSRQVTAAQFPVSLDAYEAAIKLNDKGESILPLIQKYHYEVGKLLTSNLAFDRNSGLRDAKAHLVIKNIELHPEKAFQILKDNPDVPFRDSLIKIAAYKNPRQAYDYAAADNRLGYAIRAIDDPFIRAISKMAKSPSGQLYFPFLHNILNNKISLDEIDAVKNDPVKYYKLLVKTKMGYVQSQLDGEKVLEMEALSAMLQNKAVENFIRPINELHEVENPAVRFRALTPLNAQELYYVVLAGERDLYTSSYIAGVYPAMMQKIGNRGDSLFLSVGFDHFRKFIKMAAGYNMLPAFLNSFPDKDGANTLMRAFVNGLDKKNSLEDGVDVADSYASISETMKPVAEQMLENVKSNYELAVQRNSKRGMVIYDLLYKLFQSATDSTINLSKEFNIPPVYNVSYSSLANGDSGKVVMQVFFYGDKDGRMNYAKFIPQFPASLWKRSETKQWVSFASTKGKPIVVYANKPLDEQSGEVDQAQASLSQYLTENELNPTIVIHRGHSYYAPYTIEQLAPSAKIVFLGSCGGYHLIHDVLARAEDAHIIASKQIGKQVINQPFFDLLNEKLRTGNNIEWINFWKEFKAKAGGTEGFDDYIPPQKNLGAIFIKAYKNAMGGEGEGI
ncbi:MAG: hypothetical protein EOO10_02110 [Chitinophagaceae bacterium]|nr:MAG: hypothetical protein EOO10_02110 [Chitinophagaceae bacterium]